MTRRDLLMMYMEQSGAERTPVPLHPNSRTPPLQGNSSKKIVQKVSQLDIFKEFFLANSVPTGRLLREKTHYIVPSIRLIRLAPNLKPESSAIQCVRQTGMTRESLTHHFDEYLRDLEPHLSEVDHESIFR